jgi:predicted type IV restriction endonuclease
MTQTLQARNVTLRGLIRDFKLELVRERDFFLEWREGLSELTDSEKQALDKIQEGFFNLRANDPYLERAVQVSIVSPILFLADFFLPPFHIKTEQLTEIITEDEGVTVRGQLDLIVLKDDFWVIVIESKEISYTIEMGLAQLLAYMLANPHGDKPGFGLITNGADFTFVKLLRNDSPQYATSRQFNIRNEGNELYDVFRILKRISQL